MTSCQKEKLFHQYRPMIEKFIWLAKKRLPFLEVEDIRGQAYLIFAETCERYVPGKTCFGTYLFHRLKSLYQYMDTEKKCFLEEFIEKEYSENIYMGIILEASLKELSEEAGELLYYLVNRDWETPGVGKKTPNRRNLKIAFKIFKDWPGSRFEKSWKELRAWYEENYYLI